MSGTVMAEAAQAILGAKRVAVLIGAGISVGAGIPDFRSPGGMYDTLRPELLTATEEERNAMRRDPTAVVSLTIFQRTAFPYLELRRPFILGINEEKRWKPTLSHYFLRELAVRGKLLRLYSQNIDGLEHNVPDIEPSKVVSCHGSLGRISCEFCEAPADMDWFLSELRTKIKDIYGLDETAPAESSPILCQACHMPGVKPSTVLYGSALPTEFFLAMKDDLPANADCVVVLGTSLTVGPANLVPIRAKSDVPRIIINMEPVGRDLGILYDDASLDEPATRAGRDFFLRGACDDSVATLLANLGWLDSVGAHLDSMSPSARKALEAFRASGGAAVEPVQAAVPPSPYQDSPESP